MSCKSIIFPLGGVQLFYCILTSSGRSYCSNICLMFCLVAVTMEQKSLGLWWYYITFSAIQFLNCICYSLTKVKESYIYWTVHHLDSWIKIDQLDVTCFIVSLFKAQHVSNVSTSILRSLRLICCAISWVVLLWGGVVYLCRLKQCFSLHKDTTPPQSNHTITPTHVEPEQYNP